MNHTALFLILIAAFQPTWAENGSSFINLAKANKLDECQTKVARATARLVDKGFVQENPDSSYDLCPSTQADLGISKPSDTHCTSFLVGPDLMLTNTHCTLLDNPKLSAKSLCARLVFKFDQYNNLGRKSGLERSCKEIIYSSPAAIASEITGGDFTFIRLNKAVTDREFLTLEAFGRISEEAGLVDQKLGVLKSIEASELDLERERNSIIPNNLEPKAKELFTNIKKTNIDSLEELIASSKAVLDMIYSGVPTDATKYPVFKNKNLWIFGYPLGGDLIQSKIIVALSTSAKMQDLQAVTLEGSGFQSAGNSGSPMIGNSCKVVGINFGSQVKFGDVLDKLMKGFRESHEGCYNRWTAGNLFTKSEVLINILRLINQQKLKVVNQDLPLDDSNRYLQEGLPATSIYKK